MLSLVIKPFSYAADGINAVDLVIGDEREIDDSLVPGLVKEGFISIGDGQKTLLPPTDSADLKSQKTKRGRA
jgi:hypothetical protein